MAKLLHFLIGPTAVGKTQMSLDWAEARGAEILSCDSLLFYRGMDIGTAKPALDDRRRVPHHGIDVVPVSRRFSVGEYIRLARRRVRDILGRGKAVLVTGGSGFYLKAFFTPVMDDLEIAPELRRRAETIWQREGLPGWQKILLELNPQGDSELDWNNPRRVRNALLRCLASGRTLQELREDFARRKPPFAGYEKHVCLISRSRADLHERAARRVRAMLDAGLIGEVRFLMKEGLEQNTSAASAIGYRETLAFLKGELPREGLETAILQNTRRLIRKQTTWFKTQIPVHRVLRLPSGDPSRLFP